MTSPALAASHARSKFGPQAVAASYPSAAALRVQLPVVGDTQRFATCAPPVGQAPVVPVTVADAERLPAASSADTARVYAVAQLKPVTVNVCGLAGVEPASVPSRRTS